MSPENARPGLSPLQALGRIRAILEDADLTPSEKLAVINVALHANSKTGLARPGQRTIRREAGIGGKPIEGALACPAPGELCRRTGKPKSRGKALGRHVEPAGRSSHGVRVWRVLAVSPVGAHCEDVSTARTGALKDDQRAPLDDQRPPDGRKTGVELAGRAGTHPAPRVSVDSLAARLWAAGPRPHGQNVDDARRAIGEALAKAEVCPADLSAMLGDLGGRGEPLPCFWKLAEPLSAFCQRREASASAALYREAHRFRPGDWVRRDGRQGKVVDVFTTKVTVRWADDGECDDLGTVAGLVALKKIGQPARALEPAAVVGGGGGPRP